VRAGLVSEEAALAVYGVRLDDGHVDVDATEATRERIRQERLEQGELPENSAGGGTIEDATVLHPVSDTVEAVEANGVRSLRCIVCHYRLGDYSDDHKRAAVMRQRPLRAASEVDRLVGDDVVLREYCCPGCATLIAADVQLLGDPILDESRLASAQGV
jgi:N-methylhydantoinase B